MCIPSPTPFTNRGSYIYGLLTCTHVTDCCFVSAGASWLKVAFLCSRALVCALEMASKSRRPAIPAHLQSLADDLASRKKPRRSKSQTSLSSSQGTDSGQDRFAKQDVTCVLVSSWFTYPRVTSTVLTCWCTGVYIYIYV